MEDKLLELIAMLDDPDIGEGVKATIRDTIRTLQAGGFSAAYEQNSIYLARKDLNTFSELVFDYIPAIHHKEITEALQDESRKRVLIVVPPNHAKSTYASEVYPAWYMGNNPDHSTLLISSGKDQSIKYSSIIRATVDYNPMYAKVFPDIAPDEAMGWTKDTLYVKNRKAGNPHPNILSAGVEAKTILGSRANLIVVDDPLTQTQALSERELDKQKEWFRDTLMTRLQPGGRCVVILTRWHANDLAAMLIQDLNFEVVHMPAIGDDEKGAYADHIPAMRLNTVKSFNMDDLPPRVLQKLLETRDKFLNEGFEAEITFSGANNRPCVRKYLHNDPALWPEYFDLEALETKRDIENGPVRFRLVYQGDPTGVMGDIFKREWFRYYGPNQNVDTGNKRSIPKDAVYFQSVDVALSTKAKADYFVIVTVALDKMGNYYVVDVFRQKIIAPEQREAVRDKYREFPRTLWVLIEGVAYQLALFQEVAAMNVPCRVYRPKNKKEERAMSASAVFSAKRVFLPEEAPWLNDFRDEFTSFPRAEHDDQVDAITSLFEELSTNWNPFPTDLEINFTGFGMDEEDDELEFYV